MPELDNINDIGSDDGPKKVGDFTLTKLLLSSPSILDTIDIRDLFISLDIYESIYQNSVTGKLIILDNIGLRELVPLLGEETIEVNVSGIYGQNTNNPIQRKFRVTKIEPIGALNEKALTYALILHTPEFLINSVNRVRRNFSNTKISEIVRTIYDEKIRLNNNLTAANLEVEETVNNVTFTVPNWSAFYAFNYLAKRALSNNVRSLAGEISPGALYLFYENIDGYRFESIETVIQQDPVKSFIYTPVPISNPNRSENIIIDILKRGYASVSNFEIKKFFDTVENVQKGMYSARLITHDIVRMKYNEYDFYYLKKNIIETPDTVNANTTIRTLKPLPNNIEIYDKSRSISPGKLCSDSMDVMGYPESNVKLYPTNFEHDVYFAQNTKVAGGFKQPGINPTKVENWLLYRRSQLQQLNNIILDVTVAGDSRLRAGKMINFAVPSYILNENYGGTDYFLAGKFLVSRIRHSFTRDAYMMDLELVKDSFERQIPALDLTVLDDFYNATNSNRLIA